MKSLPHSISAKISMLSAYLNNSPENIVINNRFGSFNSVVVHFPMGEHYILKAHFALNTEHGLGEVAFFLDGCKLEADYSSLHPNLFNPNKHWSGYIRLSICDHGIKQHLWRYLTTDGAINRVRKAKGCVKAGEQPFPYPALPL